MTSNALWIMTVLLTPLTLWFLMKTKTIIIEWNILTMTSSFLTLPLIMDPVGLLFSTTVLFISANVLHFATTYMNDEPHLKRFTYLVLLFVLSMNLLIYIPNMMTLLIGWDGLGITSFLLVAYYQNPKSLAAGMITALTNRIGDALLLLSIGWSLNQGHWYIINMWETPYSPLIIMSITIAAMTKSAQLPFSSWLPAAMAAPTPVSALVHSSTLVTAGVFLLIRFYPSLSKLQLFHTSLLCMATLTMFMAGMNAMAECDLKKIIALSTLSQLGVMMSSIALGLPTLALFHLVTHALFKALLFVCAGTLIHIHHHSQDLRTVGNLSHQMPLTMSALLTANLALCGLPFMAGFFSKDLIIEMSLFNPTNPLIIIMFSIATGLTAAYSMRLTLTALTTPNMSLPPQFTSDEDTNTTIPMLFLASGAIIGGAAINWMMLNPAQEPILPSTLKWSPFIITIASALLALKMTMSNSSLTQTLMKPLHANAMMWFLTPLSTQMILSSSSPAAHIMLKTIDHGWLEMLSPQGIKNLTSSTSTYTQYLQSLSITTHLTLITMAILLINL
uniref:NADH dehydrogenase subunit 5 n=1 Tax=Sirsoe methanicola TaxID=378374 RepID=UPI002036D6D8|nr:NADH dehydrogenase subunit 5 [Sirsoe methanicola]UQV94838.1 NADH dehydrogenase subunit 5 [Sirsoe methanicola]